MRHLEHERLGGLLPLPQGPREPCGGHREGLAASPQPDGLQRLAREPQGAGARGRAHAALAAHGAPQRAQRERLGGPGEPLRQLPEEVGTYTAYTRHDRNGSKVLGSLRSKGSFSGSKGHRGIAF